MQIYYKYTTNIEILRGKYRLKPLIQRGLSHFFTKIQLIYKNITNNQNGFKSTLAIAFDSLLTGFSELIYTKVSYI
ncbi:MAG: hypothetical protein ABGX53_01640, partial [Candidatus Thioglobus sp.]